MTFQISALLWLLALVCLGVAEALTVDLVAIWFAFGALVAFVFALLKFSAPVQIIVFFAFSILSLLVMKPFCKKVLKTKKTATNADSIIGMVGVVRERIDAEGLSGRIFVNGLEWKASSFDAVPIEEGEKVIVKDIKGVTAEVMKI